MKGQINPQELATQFGSTRPQSSRGKGQMQGTAVQPQNKPLNPQQRISSVPQRPAEYQHQRGMNSEGEMQRQQMRKRLMDGSGNGQRMGQGLATNQMSEEQMRNRERQRLMNQGMNHPQGRPIN